MNANKWGTIIVTYTLLQTQDQNDKIHNALGGRCVFKKSIIAGISFHYWDFKVKLEIASEHRTIAS